MDSKLQIISGAYRGRKLSLPAGARPTQNRARIALFNMLGSILDTPPHNVWDAFAGSGAFGIECLSRWPDVRVVFTDVAAESIRTINKNLAPLNVGAHANVITADALARATQFGGVSDLIFVDAPYAEHVLGANVVRKLGAVAHTGAILIWEQENTHIYAPDTDIWDVLRDKTYGRARFLILRRK